MPRKAELLVICFHSLALVAFHLCKVIDSYVLIEETDIFSFLQFSALSDCELRDLTTYYNGWTDHLYLQCLIFSLLYFQR